MSENGINLNNINPSLDNDKQSSEDASSSRDSDRSYHRRIFFLTFLSFNLFIFLVTTVIVIISFILLLLIVPIIKHDYDMIHESLKNHNQLERNEHRSNTSSILDLSSKKITEFSFYNQLIFSDGNQIKAYDLTSKHVTVLKEDGGNVTTFEVVNGTIYYTELPDSTTIRVLRGNLRESLRHSWRLRTRAMAFDYVTKKFYLLDEEVGTVSVVDHRARHLGVLMAGLEKPRDLAIDVDEGLMFVVLANSTVRADLDGSNKILIERDLNVTAITVDHRNKRIFLADASQGVIQTDYEGVYRQRLADSPVRILGLAFFENKLFWLLPAFGKRRGSVWSCEISYESAECGNPRRVVLLKNPGSIKFNAALSEFSKEIANPCELENGGCSDLCLLGSDDQRSCFCDVGRRLQSDSKSCVPVE